MGQGVEIALRWMLQNLCDDKTTMVEVWHQDITLTKEIKHLSQRHVSLVSMKYMGKDSISCGIFQGLTFFTFLTRRKFG